MIVNENILRRAEQAVELAKSFIASHFPEYDAVEMAMEQFGLWCEEQADELFDLICKMVFS